MILFYLIFYQNVAISKKGLEGNNLIAIVYIEKNQLN